MRYDILGPLQVSSDHGPLQIPGGSCAKALCWLIANRNDPVTPGGMAAALWTDPGTGSAARATAAVRSLLHVLTADHLSVNGVAVLSAPDEAVDAHRFERGVTEGTRLAEAGDHGAAEVELRTALGLWRGDPYPELERALPVVGVVDSLHELHLRAHEELFGLALRRPVGYPVVADLRSWTIRHPDRLRLHLQLAQALYRTGRQIDALETVNRARARIGSLSALTELQTAILRQDPALAAGEFTP
ncbi:AfsR/SARP family transcriptional regulator [Nocardioides alcanivorans]|uniref:AfsR/SARP family transcriptional regulator n=1 Tax=Nocardioides alcanivorans TaxID=2897352 RepID=UPI001F16CA9C|nr:AfsR/SARP family transcriptional regulator [Nocardioides alcanivorans]